VLGISLVRIAFFIDIAGRSGIAIYGGCCPGCISFSGDVFEPAGNALYGDACRHPSLEISMQPGILQPPRLAERGGA